MALYQQGVQRIEVIVKKETDGTSEKGAKETETEEVGGNETTKNIVGSTNPNRIKRVIKTNATHFLATSKQVAGLLTNYQIAGLGYKYGDQAFQDRVGRQVEIVQDVTNIASSVAMGALYGSWGGPLGAVMGALMNGISTGFSTAFKYGGREREYNFKVFKEENAIEYKRARANINLTTGRLR